MAFLARMAAAGLGEQVPITDDNRGDIWQCTKEGVFCSWSIVGPVEKITYFAGWVYLIFCHNLYLKMVEEQSDTTEQSRIVY